MIKKIVEMTIFLGVIGLALNLVFGLNTVTFITTHSYNGIVVNKYDFWNYIESIRYAFNDTARLELEVPELIWNVENSLFMVPNAVLQIAKIIVFMLNIIIYPLRLAFYVIGLILSAIGVNMQSPNNPLYWIGQLSDMMRNKILAQPPQIWQ